MSLFCFVLKYIFFTLCLFATCTESVQIKLSLRWEIITNMPLPAVVKLFACNAPRYGAHLFYSAILSFGTSKLPSLFSDSDMSCHHDTRYVNISSDKKCGVDPQWILTIITFCLFCVHSHPCSVFYLFGDRVVHLFTSSWYVVCNYFLIPTMSASRKFTDTAWVLHFVYVCLIILWKVWWLDILKVALLRGYSTYKVIISYNYFLYNSPFFGSLTTVFISMCLFSFHIQWFSTWYVSLQFLILFATSYRTEH